MACLSRRWSGMESFWSLPFHFETHNGTMASELDRFEFNAAPALGLLPLVVAVDRPDDVRRACASLYLDEEVRLKGWTRNVDVFARFLEAISFSHTGVEVDFLGKNKAGSRRFDAPVLAKMFVRGLTLASVRLGLTEVGEYAYTASVLPPRWTCRKAPAGLFILGRF